MADLSIILRKKEKTGKKMKVEAKVGIFVAIGLVFLFFLSTQVSKYANITKEGYVVYALLHNATGIERNSKVKINGVEVGYVKDFFLEAYQVKAELFIYKEIKIPKNSILKIEQDSMLGNRYLTIIPSTSPQYLKEKEILRGQKENISFEDVTATINSVALELKGFIKELRTDLKGNGKNDLKETIANLKIITSEIKELIIQNKTGINDAIININSMAKELKKGGEEFGNMSASFSNTAKKFSKTADIINNKLPSVLDKIDKIASNFSGTGKELNKKLPSILDKFTSIEKELETILKENKKNIGSAISSANRFFESGGETFKKLDKYLTKAEKSKLEVGFRSEYMTDDDYAKSYLSLAYIPTSTKYYLLEVASGDDYSKIDEKGNFIEPKKHEDSKILVSAQYGRKFGDFLLRAGLIENTGGIGIDYWCLDNKGKIKFDAFDFNGVNDVRGDNAHLKITLEYKMMKFMEGYVGIDNSLNSKCTNLFLGIGINL